MIQVTPHMRILVAVEPVDFRAGIDALEGVCRRRLDSDPFDGGLFVFANQRRSAIKILIYDGTFDRYQAKGVSRLTLHFPPVKFCQRSTVDHRKMPNHPANF